MRIRTYRRAACLLLLAVPAYAQGARDTPTAAPLASVSLPPELDRVLRDYERGWRAGDANQVAALFADDGFVLQGGRAAVRGRVAIKSAYTGQGGPLTLRALAYATADTVGYIIGAYTYDQSQGDQGKFTLTLRRGPDKRWLINSDMDNTSQMARRPTPAPQE